MKRTIFIIYTLINFTFIQSHANNFLERTITGESTIHLKIAEYFKGSTIGISDDNIIIVGGIINSRSSSDSLSNRISLYKLIDSKIEKSGQFVFPESISFGQIICHSNSFVYLGGIKNDEINKNIYQIEVLNDQIVVNKIGELPFEKPTSSATLFQNKIWISGISNGQNIFWSYDFNTSKWSPAFTRNLNSNAKLVSQNDGNQEMLYLIEFDDKNNYWTISKLTNLQMGEFKIENSFSTGNHKLKKTFSIGYSNILLVFDNKSVDGDINFFIYNTITKKNIKLDSNIGINIEAFQQTNDKIVIVGNKGDNSNELICSPIINKTRFAFLDIFFLAFYCFLLIIIGYYFSRREKTISDYFKGGKRIPAWAAGISLIATTFSAVSFMSLPGKSFSTNILYIFIPLGSLIAIYFVIKWILPFFMRLNITSAYEYLEKRFSSGMRTVGSSIFILGELFRLGIILLLPAMVLSVVSGFNIYYSIIIMGMIATI